MKRLLLALPVLAALAAPQVQAQSIKPGLWQLNNKVETGNAQTDLALDMAMQQLANLPPAQRAQMDAMLAQNGVSAPQVGEHGSVAVQACVTPEMAAKKELPMNQKGQCNVGSVPVAGGMNVAFSCINPVSSGKGKVRFSDDSHYTMTMDVTTEATGAPQQLKINSTGRWIDASCPAAPKG